MANHRILITGAKGMLGRELVAGFTARNPAGVTAFSGPDDLDIADQASVQRVFATVEPQLVINAAAYTNVDGAERDAAAAHKANTIGPAVLAKQCYERAAVLVHYSTDYIFEDVHSSPIPIDAEKAPINEYGRSKLAGEDAIVASGCEYLIIRTSWLYAAHGNNFVRTIYRLASERDSLKVVNDQRGCPTYAPDLVQMTAALLDSGARGVYHAANSGECTWFAFAQAIIEIARLDCEIQPCTTAEFPRPAARPRYSVFDISRLSARIGPPRHWRDALTECVPLLEHNSHLQER
ncbi:MAG: dTDP-4-dehydrorhamnose reductase [Phycisphaerales bacterium]